VLYAEIIVGVSETDFAFPAIIDDFFQKCRTPCATTSKLNCDLDLSNSAKFY